MTLPTTDLPIQNHPMWNQLRFAVYRLTYRVRTPMLLPAYKGSVFRGVLGQQLKRISDDVYRQLFETVAASVRCPSESEGVSPFLANLNDVPPPYILEPPLTDQRFFEPGEAFVAHLILVGDAIDYLPFFVFALSEAGRGGLGSWINGRRGTCVLETIESLCGWEDSSPVEIYSGADQILSDASVILILDTIRASKEGERGTSESRRETGESESPFPFRLSPFPFSSGRCVLEFLTPTRLKVKEHLTIDLSFEVLLRALMRRVSALAYYYCGLDLFFSPQPLLEEARSIRVVQDPSLRWVDWERHSSPQHITLAMGGFVGEIAFEGNLLPFEPFLLLGEYFHVGKGTSLGLGKYRIQME